MIDSRLPRFSQGVQAAALALAFLLDLRWVVPIVAVVLIAAAIGGPRWNALAYVYRALPIPPGDMEPAAPARFAQSVGAVLLTVSAVTLFAADRDTTVWWAFGWTPALIVAVLAGIAAATSF